MAEPFLWLIHSIKQALTLRFIVPMRANSARMLVATAWQTVLLFGAIALKYAGRSQDILSRSSSYIFRGVCVRVEI